MVKQATLKTQNHKDGFRKHRSQAFAHKAIAGMTCFLKSAFYY